MGCEIERKFLIDPTRWRRPVRGVRMIQGYLTRQDGLTVRVRIAGRQGFLTLKGATNNFSRSEYEYRIPAGDAEALLREFAEGALVRKTRYRCRHREHWWEVDVFEEANAGLIMAEIELSSEDECFALPAWVTREVSFDSRYRNGNLALHPYCEWQNTEKN